jgi:hypothetical protein
MAHQAITSNNLNMLVDKPVSGLRCELLSDKLLAQFLPRAPLLIACPWFGRNVALNR